MILVSCRYVLVLSLLASVLPGKTLAQAVDLIGSRVERRAAGALAVLGISAVPSETASALAFDTGSEPGGGADFRAGQLDTRNNPPFLSASVIH